MAFKFRLEGVYKIRKEEEYEAQQALGKLLQKKRSMEDNLASIRMARNDWSEVYNQKGMTSSEAMDVMLVEKYLIALDEQEKAQIMAIRTITFQIDAALKEFEAAYKARKQVEFLRDKNKAEYDEDIKRRENMETMEMTTLRFAHQKLKEAEFEEAALKGARL